METQTVNFEKVSNFRNQFSDFLKLHCYDQIVEILQRANNQSGHTVLIRFDVFHKVFAEFGNKLLQTVSAFEQLDQLDSILRSTMVEIYATFDHNEIRQQLNLKEIVAVRFDVQSFKNYFHLLQHNFPDTDYEGQFVYFRGTITRVHQIRLIECKTFFKCSKCQFMFASMAAIYLDYAFPIKERYCPKGCHNPCIQQVKKPESETFLKNYQELKIQENMTSFSSNAQIVKSCKVVLEDDLVNTCKPGDDVIIVGVVYVKWKKVNINSTMEGDLCVKANNICVANGKKSYEEIDNNTLEMFTKFWQSHNKDPFKGRDLLVSSFCPEITGMHLVKLAICVVIAGGVEKEQTGSKVRGNSHLLLVGGPSTGKTQLLKFASLLSPRTIFVSGSGTTSAGLTVSAVNENGEWHLEPGCLVIANDGICCIDEMSNMKETDIVQIHEAMEQQTISVAKAGLHCDMATKCTILASTSLTTNKRKRNEQYDDKNHGITTPLLSRFDLSYYLEDPYCPSWDKKIAEFILLNKAHKRNELWSAETLQTYLAYVKEKKPTMIPEAVNVIESYYEAQRQNENRNPGRTTKRLLDSLYRIAEGHSKLMFSDTVSVHDAVNAVMLVDATMSDSAIVPIPNLVQMFSSEYPINEYARKAEIILSRLQLNSVWEKERALISHIKRDGRPIESASQT